MFSNKMEYSTAKGPYCMTHNVKVPFWMTEFSISKIILHPCHVENNEGESGIGCDMIIGRNLMVHLGISDKFKNQVLQRGGATSPMK